MIQWFFFLYNFTQGHTMMLRKKRQGVWRGGVKNLKKEKLNWHLISYSVNLNIFSYAPARYKVMTKYTQKNAELLLLLFIIIIIIIIIKSDNCHAVEYKLENLTKKKKKNKKENTDDFVFHGLDSCFFFGRWGSRWWWVWSFNYLCSIIVFFYVFFGFNFNARFHFYN